MRSIRVASLAAGAVLASGLVQPAAAGGFPFDLPFLAPPSFEPKWTGVHLGSQAGYSFGANLIDGIDLDGDVSFGGARNGEARCSDKTRTSAQPASTTLGWLDDPTPPCSLRALYDFGRTARITRFAPASEGLDQTRSSDLEAMEAGIVLGADLQIGRVVIGTLVDINAFGFDTEFGGSGNRSSSGVTSGTERQLDWYASLRARAGFAFDRFLGYVHGGMIYSRADRVRPKNPAAGDDLFGYTLGGGIEAMLTPKASARLEYQYAEVNAASMEDLLGGRRSAATDVDFQTVRLGLALRF